MAFSTVLLTSMSGFAQRPADAPDLAKLEDGIIARAQQEQADQRNGRAIFCTQHTHVENLNENGSVKEKHDVVAVPVLLGGRVFMKVVERDGAPLTGKHLKNEKEREEKFLEAAAH